MRRPVPPPLSARNVAQAVCRLAARENLNVTTIVFANRAYASLEIELKNVGATQPGRVALDMLDIGRPDLDWVKMAEGMGVEAARADTTDKMADLLRRSVSRPGPFLIEVPC